MVSQKESEVDISTMPLGARQKQVWEMTHGLGEYKTPMRAREIADTLGISTNSVYVNRRRVRKILEDHGVLSGTPAKIQPRRIIRQTSENRMDSVIHTIEEQIQGYDDEERALTERLEQIRKEKPELEAALNRLRTVLDGQQAVAA